MNHQGATLHWVFVDGAWQQFEGERRLPLVNPDTANQVGTLVCADTDVVDLAVNSARRAQDLWMASSMAQRLALISKVTELIEQRSEEFARTISAEIGAPIDFARSAQVGAAIAHMKATQHALKQMEVDSTLDGDPMHRVRFEAVGVAALITPWNWPLNQVVLKLGAALAAGCTTVLKPSEFSTRTAVLLADCMAEAGTPAGVFNLLIGDGHTGAELVAHPGIDMVSFTGSTRAGQHVAQTASKRFARSAMELGGKSPNLLFEDCDLNVAIRQGLAHCFRNSGQSCNAASRMLVARSIYGEAVELAAKTANATQLGRPSEAGLHFGPLVNKVQFDRVTRLIEKGIASDARLVAGGLDRPPHLHDGYYVCPTVFAEVDCKNPLFQEEIFGPVLTMTPFDDEDQAIQLANATRYGLAAYIQTADAVRADRIARQLRAGMVQVNGTSRAAGAPFGGLKFSGYGREGGLWGIRSFQEVKSISGAAAAT